MEAGPALPNKPRFLGISFGVRSKVHHSFAAVGILAVAACSAPEALPEQTGGRQELPAPKPTPTYAHTPPAEEPRFTGTPAQPLGGEAATRTAILGKVDSTEQGQPRCRIDFAYRGYEPESLFWREPCADLTVAFLDRAELEKLNRWSRLEPEAQESIATRTDGKVLYVAGEFSASVFPVSYNQLTEEIMVAD